MAADAAAKSEAWFELNSCCIHCRKDDYSCQYGPRSLLLCSCCPKGTHVECYKKATGISVTQEFIDSGSSWFCSEACSKISSHFEGLVGKRMPIKGESAEYSLEIVKYDKESKAARSVVEAAKNIFKSAFDPLVMENGLDLVAMCCQAYESPDEADDEELVDYSAFRVAALRKGGQVIAVATLRVFGDKLAEMPFVATRQGFRRAGHCRRLVKGVEALLRHLCVRWLVLPSIRSVLAMWRYSFSFIPLTLEEQAALEPHIVSPDYESAQLVKKSIGSPMSGAHHHCSKRANTVPNSRRSSQNRSKGRGRAGQPAQRSTRLASIKASAAESGPQSDQEHDLGFYNFGGRKLRTTRATSANSKPDSGDTIGSSSSSEDEDAAAKEAAAAWELWEAAGGKMGSHSNDDSDYNAGGSSSDSFSSDSDVELVPDKGAGGKELQSRNVLVKQQQLQQQQQQTNRTEAGDNDLAAAEAAALRSLRRDVEKAGGTLPDGWTVRLSNKQPSGSFKGKKFIEPGTGKSFLSTLGVRRHLGLSAPLRTGRGPAPFSAAAAAPGPAAAQHLNQPATSHPSRNLGCTTRAGPPAIGASPLDAQQQLAQLKLLREHAVASKQLRLRVTRARRKLVAEGRLAAVLAEAIRTFFNRATAPAASNQQTARQQLHAAMSRAACKDPADLHSSKALQLLTTTVTSPEPQHCSRIFQQQKQKDAPTGNADKHHQQQQQQGSVLHTDGSVRSICSTSSQQHLEQAKLYAELQAAKQLVAQRDAEIQQLNRQLAAARAAAQQIALELGTARAAAQAVGLCAKSKVMPNSATPSQSLFPSSPAAVATSSSAGQVSPSAAHGIAHNSMANTKLLSSLTVQKPALQSVYNDRVLLDLSACLPNAPVVVTSDAAIASATNLGIHSAAQANDSQGQKPPPTSAATPVKVVCAAGIAPAAFAAAPHTTAAVELCTQQAATAAATMTNSGGVATAAASPVQTAAAAVSGVSAPVNSLCLSATGSAAALTAHDTTALAGQILCPPPTICRRQEPIAAAAQYAPTMQGVLSGITTYNSGQARNASTTATALGACEHNSLLSSLAAPSTAAAIGPDTFIQNAPAAGPGEAQNSPLCSAVITSTADAAATLDCRGMQTATMPALFDAAVAGVPPPLNTPPPNASVPMSVTSAVQAGKESASAPTDVAVAEHVKSSKVNHTPQRSPRLSDGFLSDLLPYVVGQIMDTPHSASCAQSAATTSAAESPAPLVTNPLPFTSAVMGDAAAAAATDLQATTSPSSARVNAAQKFAAIVADKGPSVADGRCFNAKPIAAAFTARSSIALGDPPAEVTSHQLLFDSRRKQPAAAAACMACHPTTAATAPVTAAHEGSSSAAAAETGSCSPPSPQAQPFATAPSNTVAQQELPLLTAAAHAERTEGWSACKGEQGVCSSTGSRLMAGTAASGTNKRTREAAGFGANMQTGSVASYVGPVAAPLQAQAEPVCIGRSINCLGCLANTASGPCAVCIGAPEMRAANSNPGQQQQRQLHESTCKKRKVRSTVLQWFGDIIDLDDSDTTAADAEASAGLDSSGRDDSSSGQGSGGHSSLGVDKQPVLQLHTPDATSGGSSRGNQPVSRSDHQGSPGVTPVLRVCGTELAGGIHAAFNPCCPDQRDECQTKKASGLCTSASTGAQAWGSHVAAAAKACQSLSTAPAAAHSAISASRAFDYDISDSRQNQLQAPTLAVDDGRASSMQRQTVLRSSSIHVSQQTPRASACQKTLQEGHHLATHSLHGGGENGSGEKSGGVEAGLAQSVAANAVSTPVATVHQAVAALTEGADWQGGDEVPDHDICAAMDNAALFAFTGEL